MTSPPPSPSPFSGRGWLALVGFLLPLASGCTWGGSFSTQFAPRFTPGGHTVSVLAVYKDGLLSSAAWDVLAQPLAADFAGSPCIAGYDALTQSKPDVSQALDDRAREEGPTDELLGELAPAAEGDLILVMTEAGRLAQRLVPPSPRHRGPSSAPPAGLVSGSRRSRGPAGTPGMPGLDAEIPDAPTDSLEISAVFYSVERKESVAVVALDYAGTDLDRALSELAKKLGASMPAMRCAGWNWDAVSAIRRGLAP